MLSQTMRSMCGCFLVLCGLSLHLNAATVTYDFSSGNHTSLRGSNTTLTATSDLSSFTDSNINTQNGSSASYSASTRRHYPKMLYRFSINEDAADINSITATWVGFGDHSSNGQRGAVLYIRNFNGSFEQLDSSSSSSLDTLTGSVSSNISNYIDDGEIEILSVNSGRKQNNNQSATHYTDYVKIELETTSIALPSPRLEYRFDECSLATGVTDSASFYDGTANSADSTDSVAQINRSLDLSATGTLDWITVPQSAVNSLNDFSVSVWIKTAVSKSQQEIFHALGSSTGDEEIEIYLVNSTQVRLNVGDSGATISAGTTLTDDSWHHLLVTRSGNGMCLYVDGGLAGCHTSGSSGQISINDASAVVIGQEQDAFGGSFSSSQAFDGYMDEFKIYAAELDASHASQIYTNEGNGLNADGSTRASVTCTSVLPTPLAEYRLDEGSWSGVSGEIVDSIGSNNGSIVDTGSGNVTSIVDGKVCRAGNIGQNTTAAEQYAIDTTIDIDDQVGNTGTISFWYRSSTTWGTDGRKVLLSASTPDPNNKYFFLTEETDSRLRFGLENTSDADYRYSSSSTFSYGSSDWVHLVVTWDMTGQQMQLFVNGEEEINSSIPSSLGIGELLSLYVGDNRGSYIAGEGANSANGDVDEILIFNSVLSNADISSIYTNQNAGKNYDGSLRPGCSALADWHFDESGWNGTADEVEDSSGNDNHGVAQNADTISSGAICRAGDFDGVTDYVTATDLSQLQTTASLIFWIKTTQSGNDVAWQAPGVAGIEENGGADDIFWGWIDASGHIGLTVGDDYAATKSNTVINDGSWHHVVLTREVVSGEYKIYIDGALDKSGTSSTGDIGNGFSSIGRMENTQGTPVYFDGQLDEVIIFEDVLADSDVSDIYANQVAGKNWNGTVREECASAVSYYEISHSSPALTCEAANITITAKDESGQSIAPESGTTISLSSELVAGANVANTFSPATYTFDGTSMATTVQLIRTSVGVLDIDVDDGSATDRDGDITDPDIEYADAAFKFYADGVLDGIDIQIAGKLNNIAPNAQVVTIKAIQTDPDTGRCTALKPGSGINVGFGYQCISPNTCAADDALFVNGNGTPAPGVDLAGTPTYVTSAVDFNAAGEGEIVFDYRDAGQIQLFVQAEVEVTGGSGTATIEGSSNSFIVRPFAFGFSSIQAGSVDNPQGDETSGSGFTSAGSDFDVTVNAYLYQTAYDTDQNGVPDAGVDVTVGNDVTPNFAGDVELSVDSFTPASGIEGNLTGETPLTFESYLTRGGTAVTGTLQYDEVGSINIKASLANYLGSIAGDVTSVPVKVGRFYPDHFAIVSDSIVASCSSSFTYMQQPFAEFKYTIEARPAGVTDSTASDAQRITQNYDYNEYSGTATIQAEAENDNLGIDLGTRLGGYSNSDNWQLGEYAFDSTSTFFSRNPDAAGLEDGPFNKLQLGLSISSERDARGFSTSELTMNAADNNDCVVDGNCSAAAIGGEQILRYGRLQIQSVHGPESEDLEVPFSVQYWDGSAFVTSLDDSCTVIPLSSIAFDSTLSGVTDAERTVSVGDGSTLGSLNITGANAAATAGEFNLGFSAPGVGTGGDDNTGSFPVEVVNLDAWLRYDWNQDGSGDDANLPDAIVTFGRARGSDRMIFWQERYQ
ncbi:LamG domain-containing protein [Neptuniibacter sp. 2_MG-2023]|uniref:LamG domain-containing protein n=1 Tax=Neptuniibacter sp. 2_MG-2023 TaxID=3062671 RepID=UPI0026E26363|nr:LamG domain-containing protein [Neptuniibacter sp. 2_MG-2023]MDO6515268.1 LamG domain-containing protein [Neptuniibacter sp. 2_MG-2023]